MAITIDWPTQVINVPRNDMLLVQSAPSEIRELDLDAFRLELKGIEASIEGMPFLDTHSHNPPVTVGGVTLARVVEIINGYTVTFEDGQYAVNLVGANSNVADITNVNQVSVRSANSAGLTYSKEVEDQSFAGARVWVNSVVGLPGTQFPRGTPGDPVSNIADAQSIISQRNLPKRLHLRGSFTLNSGDSLEGYDIEAGSAKLASLDFGYAITSDMVISAVDISGIANGEFTADTVSSFSNLSNFAGKMVDGGLDGSITLASATRHEFINCHSRVSGTSSTPIIDCDNLPNLNLSIRGYTGGLELINVGGSGTQISIDLIAGHVILDSSVTMGDIVIRGPGYVTDNSAGATVNTIGVTARQETAEVIRKFMTNRMETNPSTGVLTLYDDDDTTVLYSGNIYEDVLAVQLYRGQGLERRNRLT